MQALTHVCMYNNAKSTSISVHLKMRVSTESHRHFFQSMWSEVFTRSIWIKVIRLKLLDPCGTIVNLFSLGSYESTSYSKKGTLIFYRMTLIHMRQTSFNTKLHMYYMDPWICAKMIIWLPNTMSLYKGCSPLLYLLYNIWHTGRS